MACPSCGSASSKLRAPINVNDQLARPLAPWFPPTYLFIDESQNKFENPDLSLVIAQVTQFRHENNLPAIAYLQETILNFTMLSDDRYAQHREMYNPSPEVSLSAKQYIAAAFAYLHARTLTPEELFVTQEEAERRAAICLNCPRNVHTVNGRTKQDPGLGQSKFVQLAKGRTTTVDNSLNLCGVCTCVLTGKVHISPQIIKESTTQELLGQFKQEYVMLNGKPGHCWIGDF